MRICLLPSLLSFCMSLCLAAPATGQASGPFDVLFVGGRVIDGTGNPWIRADVGVRDGRIDAVGALADAPAARRIDAAGLTIVPGFIDLHSHAAGLLVEGGCRWAVPRRRAAPNLVTQGITTVVCNQDGRSPWPIRAQRDAFDRNGIGLNAVLLAGHGTLRRRVMGADFRRTARPDEIAAMRRLLRQAVTEGARGLSAGLEYEPGRWSTSDELTALVAEIVPAGGVYVAHQRSEGGDPMWFFPSVDSAGAPTLLDGIRETIAIGEQTGARVVASHVKAKGAHFWGTSEDVIRLIEEARARGVQIWADQYPYTTSGSDGTTVLIPEWALREPGAGNPERNEVRLAASGHYGASLRRVLADPERADALRRDVAHEIRRRGGADRIVVFAYPDATYLGRTLADLAERRGETPVETALALQLEGNPDRPGGARLRGFSMDVADLDAFAVQPWTLTASDAGIALPGDPPVHPRFYGTYPRKLRRYALDRKLISVEDVVRSATSLPAQVLGLTDRGLVRTGFVADLAVLDLDRVHDRATFENPHQTAEGIPYVLIGGVFVVYEGEPTGALPGRVLAPPPTREIVSDD